MRVTDNTLLRQFTASFESARSDLSNAVTRLADGKRVRVPSDDPAGARISLELRGEVVRLEGYVRSSAAARTGLASIDALLGEAFNLVNTARSEALAGASGVTGSVISIRADRVDSLRDQLLALANTSQQGRHLFAGTETRTVPFDAAGVYSGNDAEVQAPVQRDLQVSTTLSGRQVFQGGGGDLFRQLADLVTALNANDIPSIQTAISELDAQLDHLAEIRGRVGLRLETIDQAAARQEDDLVRVRGRIGDLENELLERLAIDVAAAESQLEALSATVGRVLGRSLFDFIG